MQNSDANHHGAKCGRQSSEAGSWQRWFILSATVCALLIARHGLGADAPDPSDPILNLFLQKGFITENEAAKAKAEIEAMRTNIADQYPASKWRIGSGIKNVELFGDIRLRYEARQATEPNLGGHNNGSIDLNRMRYALRLGLRGEANDEVYYGLRIDTSANPRSTWVTFGNSTAGAPGPSGKSTAGIYLGQIYLGWRPEDWFEITLGKMPNPLYTTTMVWSPSLSPEGAAEHFKYTVGEADLFANFGQFIYQDTSPNSYTSGFFNPLSSGTSVGGTPPLLLAWQLGVDYHLTKKIDLKMAPVIYNYTRFNTGTPPPSTPGSPTPSPDFSGTYIGQGASAGPGPNGGYTVPASYNLGSANAFDGFYANQTGINDLLVIEFPFELNVKLDKYDLRWFGDYAQNLQGADRANAAYNGVQAVNSYYAPPGGGNTSYLVPISSPQTHDTKAYQIGFAIGSTNSLGLVNGSVSSRHGWEFRTYYQHVEQYALDPNLIDTDFFEGVENMEGIYTALAYGFTANLIGTVRYGHANRINDKLATGGSGADIPQMNPINNFNLFQVDVSFRF